MMNHNSIPLSQQATNKTIQITNDDMIHITWKHATIRMNVTGLLYLVRYLNDNQAIAHQSSHFEIYGTPDDGYQLWIQDVGLRLTPDEYRSFLRLLVNGLDALEQRKNALKTPLLGEALLFTFENTAQQHDPFHSN